MRLRRFPIRFLIRENQVLSWASIAFGQTPSLNPIRIREVAAVSELRSLLTSFAQGRSLTFPAAMSGVLLISLVGCGQRQEAERSRAEAAHDLAEAQATVTSDSHELALANQKTKSTKKTKEAPA